MATTNIFNAAVSSALIVLSFNSLSNSFSLMKSKSVARSTTATLSMSSKSEDFDGSYNRLQSAADEYFRAMSKRMRGNLMGAAAGEVSSEDHFNRPGPWDEPALSSLIDANKVISC